MKILYIVSRPLEINTSASIRNRATILGLIDNGNTVDLVTTEPDCNHPAYDSSLGISGIDTKYIKLGGIQSAARIGHKLNIPLKKEIVQAISKHEIYDNLKGIVKHINEVNANEYDLIISSSDPKSSHLFALLLTQNSNYHGKWIQIWGDPFLKDITLNKSRIMKKIRKEEEKLLKACDGVIYVSKMTLEEQKKLYPEEAYKMHFVPVPYLTDRIQEIRNLKNSRPIKISYCGDYNSAVRKIRPLYDAMKRLENVACLTICGNSDVSLSPTANISVLKRQSYSNVQHIEDDADILVHLSNIRGGQIPGKIYQYSGTNKPILFILDGEKELEKELFSKYNRYYFSNNEVVEIRNTLCKIIEDNRSFDIVKDFSKQKVANDIIRSVWVNDNGM